MEENYAKALAEIDDIIKYADKESKEKISEEFIKFVKDNKDKNYKTKIDPNKKIEEQEILYETKVILASMYRDFWATEEERSVIDNKINFDLAMQQKEFEKTVKSAEEMFKKEDSEINLKNISEEVNLLPKDESKSIFSKILDFIKKLFHKK